MIISLHLFMVLCENGTEFRIQVLGQSLLHGVGHFTAPLAMTIGYREEVAVLQIAKVRYCYPSILVYFVWV